MRECFTYCKLGVTCVREMFRDEPWPAYCLMLNHFIAIFIKCYYDYKPRREKTCLRDCDQVFLNPACSAAETSLTIESLHEASLGTDQRFLEGVFICIKGWGYALLILSHFS